MRIVIISLLLISSLSVIAQDCKRFLDKEEDIFDSKSLFSESIIFDQPTISISRSVRFKTTDKGRLYVEYKTSVTKDIKMGNSIIFHFEDGKQIEYLFFFAQKEKKGSVISFNSHSWIKNEDDLKQFYQKNISEIELPSLNEKYAISKKKANAFLRSIQCISDSYGLSNLKYGGECKQKLNPPSFNTFVTIGRTSSSSFDCVMASDSLNPAIVSTEFERISAAPGDIEVSIVQDDNKYFLIIRSGYDFGCVNASSYVSFNFITANSLTVSKLLDFNEKERSFKIDITNNEDLFKDSNIDRIRISLSESYLDIKLIDTQFLRKALKTCFR